MNLLGAIVTGLGFEVGRRKFQSVLGWVVSYDVQADLSHPSVIDAWLYQLGKIKAFVAQNTVAYKY